MGIREKIQTKEVKERASLRKQAAFSEHYTQHRKRERWGLPSKRSGKLHPHTVSVRKRRLNAKTTSLQTTDVHTKHILEKTDENTIVLFLNGLEDMKGHISKSEKLRKQVTELKKVAV